ncbi:MAG: Hsp20/alpha crystallin family protein [Promethearchaeota archaeon]|jgi:HSP20 family protein
MRSLSKFNCLLNGYPYGYKNRSLFDDVFNNDNWFTFETYPDDGVKFDVKEYDDKVEMVAEVPGYSKKDIKIEYDNEVLTISGKVEEKKEENVKYLYKEIKSRQFERNFKIGKHLHLDASAVDAEFKEGRLHVTLPKVELEDAKKTIKIK